MTAPPAEGAGNRLAEGDDEQILDALEKWLERDVRPHVLKLEHDDVYPAAMVEQMKAFGLFGATIAPRYGGLGMSAATYARVVTLISEAWIALPGAFNTHLIMAALVERFGTEAQQRHFLPRFARGELRGGLALTEADGGTDLQAIRTRAVRAGDQYVINGAKTWITNAIEGSCFALLVKTAPDAAPRHRGMSLFLAEKGPGLRVGRRLEKLGYHGSDTAELFFEDYTVPEGRLIGGAEGHGFVQVMAGLELGRINVAARSVGLANAALKDSLRYAQMRRTFGKPIAEHQTIQLKLAEMATRCEAARLLTECAARAYDRGGRCAMEAGMAKYFASEAALANSQEALRIHGAAGYSKDLPIERYYRDAPLLCIGEGTNEIQRIVIAKELLARNPA
jgi:alkylation response protein AidB-like acyl-CoA dehydrogenase